MRLARLRIGAAPSTPDAPACDRWAAIDLAHGLPRLADAQSGQWTPQQLSLDRLRAYSVKKGCYPGQEIVARTHFLGQAKRGLVLFDGRCARGARALNVRRRRTSLGTVVSCATSDRRDAAARRAAAEHAMTPCLTADGIALRERPLLRRADALSKRAMLSSRATGFDNVCAAATISLFGRNHQERSARERRERVRADHALQRLRAVACLGDRRDHALAHAGAVAAFVDDDDALRTRLHASRSPLR